MFASLMCPTWFLLLLGGFVLLGVARVSGIEIYAPSEVEAVNGTTVRLKCTFRSSHPVSDQSVVVSWNFRPLNSKREESVFYYQEVAYPPKDGRFKNHAVWSGDVSRSDASITLLEVPLTFNGTYICNVRNRPDVHGNNRETTLSVVTKATVSEITILIIAVVSGCLFILVLLSMCLAVKFYKRKRRSEDMEMHAQEPNHLDPELQPKPKDPEPKPKRKRKDPTVCRGQTPDNQELFFAG
ncbi:myelin protein zero-like protein 2 isoform X4 [Syngnathus acus]|uniref:myelin protein zero-like protein 2 isoform X4 n=1 Tax=Syngnathus acus TaxID=161584 RepID=UPI001885C9B5|nr:myelin protein zero-like protein 2 isoform X4 [Syngnathus acus]